MRLAPLALAGLLVAGAAAADPVSILFVGNSYTFGRLDPVLTYNAANVRDLTKPQGPAVVGSTADTPKFSDVTGTNSYPLGLNNPSGVQGNSYSPHSQTIGWGGVPGIFKQLTVQAGLDYDVALSTRNAATLRGHFLNTANSTNWDLRGNISSQKWDKMVLQEQSDEALGPQTVNGVPLGSNFPSIRANVDLIEDWVHTGRPIQDGVMTNNPTNTTYRERNMFYLGGTTAAGGGPGGQYANEAACVAAGGTSSSCSNSLVRTIPNNTNSNAATEIYLQQTWARPNLINSPGTPTIDPATGDATYDTTKPVPSYFGTLEAMTSDMTTGMLNVANFADDDGSSGIKGIIPVGQAFLSAVQAGIATRNMYAPDALTDNLIDLWFNDGTHASVAGSYLSALTNFGSITGLDPAMFGADEIAARDLGLSSADALKLQHIASMALGYTNPVPRAGHLGHAARRPGRPGRGRPAPSRRLMRGAALAAGTLAALLAGCAGTARQPEAAPHAVAPQVWQTLARDAQAEPVPQPQACPKGVPADARCLGGTDRAGAHYLIALPAAWSGVLVLHAHGGPTLGPPLKSRAEEDLTRWVDHRARRPCLGRLHLPPGRRRGARGGRGHRAAAPDLRAPRGAAPSAPCCTGRAGAPAWLRSARRCTRPRPRAARAPYDAVLLTSGVLAGGTRSYDFRIDLRVIYQHLCGNHPHRTSRRTRCGRACRPTAG